MDHRQNINEFSQIDMNYTSGLKDGIKGMKIGYLKEGFAHPNSQKEVDETVRSTFKIFEELGATVQEVSIPWHATCN